MKTLESIRELGYRAYLGTSFSPEKRAELIVNDFSEEFDQDVEKLQSKGCDQEYIARYKESYLKFIKSWLSAKSMRLSTMIAGPSKFPVRRAEKANRTEESRYKEFRDFRDKVFAGVEKRARKNQIEEAGGELEVAKKKLADLIEKQNFMKAINKAHSAYVKNPLSLIESGLSEEAQQAVIKWVPQYSFERHPFQTYQLTNNNAKIKSTEARVKELESKEEKATTGDNKEIRINGGVCEYNYLLDRITIKHDQKPAREVIETIKSHGFKWSPHYGVWMRKITDNAIYVTEKILLPKLAA